MRNNILFLVVLTWLRQLQQYFYKLAERSPNQNWSKYGNYCEILSTLATMKNTPLANIWFAKNDGVKIQVTNIDFFRPKKSQSDYFVRRMGIPNSQPRCSACFEGSTKRQ